MFSSYYHQQVNLKRLLRMICCEVVQKSKQIVGHNVFETNQVTCDISPEKKYFSKRVTSKFRYEMYLNFDVKHWPWTFMFWKVLFFLWTYVIKMIFSGSVFLVIIVNGNVGFDGNTKLNLRFQLEYFLLIFDI